MNGTGTPFFLMMKNKRHLEKPFKCLLYMVGCEGLEPPTFGV